MAVGEANRRLILVPIVHTQEDMGGLREAVRRLYIQRHGLRRWEAHVRAIESLWRNIRARIDSLGLDFRHVRLYQDGLPVCGKEETIVADLARAGSLNHRLVVDLMTRGAKLTGTESPKLLVEEYQAALGLLGEAPKSEKPESAAEFDRQSRSLLERRDRFIADRIDETLLPGETGLIFLGMFHRLLGGLPPDIASTTLDAPIPEGLGMVEKKPVGSD